MGGHDTVVVASIPKCSFCDKPGVYDAKTTLEPWADLCEAHFQQLGCGLGLGRGQKRILSSELSKNPEISFEDWMHQVDVALESEIGMDSSILPDRDYYTYYESGMKPKEVAQEVLEEEMGGLLG